MYNSAENWLIVMELLPAFSLYRGLYELSQYSFSGDYMGTHGMQWTDLSDHLNGMKDVLIIIVAEWLILLPFAYYIDRTASRGNISMKGLFSVLQRFLTKKSISTQRSESGKVFIEMEKPDVIREVSLNIVFYFWFYLHSSLCLIFGCFRGKWLNIHYLNQELVMLSFVII